MLADLQSNDTGIFNCLTINSSPAKDNKEMETNTVGYLLALKYEAEGYSFDFINNPFLITDSKLNRLLSLNNDWDGYNAISIVPKVGKNAKKFILQLNETILDKISDVFANPHGTITFEWENGDAKKIALEIGSNSYSYFVTTLNKPPILVDGKDIFSNLNEITTQIYNVLGQENA